MSYALPYRDQSRAPLAFTLSVVLHGLFVGAFLAFFLFHPPPTPLTTHAFELVSGPPSADEAGPVSTPGPLLSVANLRSVDTTPQPPVSAPPVPVAPAPTQPVQAAPAPTKPTAVKTPVKPTTPVSTRGATPAPTKQPKIITAAEWQKMQGLSTPPASTRSAARPVPKVGVSTDGIMDNLNKLASGGGSPARSGNSGNKANVGDNGAVDDYMARVIQQIRAVFVAPPAIDGLSATFRMVIAADGTVISAHILQRSPDDRFNSAVSLALSRLKNVGPPPGGEQITQDFKFVPSAL